MRFLDRKDENPVPRMRMLDGFNENWIEFERGKSGSHKGTTSLEAVPQISHRARLDQHVTAATWRRCIFNRQNRMQT